MAPQVKDFEEFLAQAMTSSSTTTISASPSLASSSLYSSNNDNSDNSDINSSSPSSSDPSPSSTHDHDLEQLEQQHRNDDSFYDNLSFDTPPLPQAPSSSRSHAIYLNPHSQELSPMQLVTLSNLKLNNEIFSNRSLSIQKRILVKNLLTMLYTLHSSPPEWHYQIQEEQQQEEPGQGPDKTNKQWTTLDAAGLQASERSSSLQSVPPSPLLTPQSSSNNPFLNNINHSSPSPPSTSSLEPPGSSKDTKTPLPRPKSTDLPQSLHSYLSTVFDVDWSVGLSTTEDSLFTLHGAGSSSAGAGSSSQTLSGPGAGPLSSSPKRKSLSASSSLSLSLSLSDFMTPSGSGNNTHANGNTKEGTGSSTSTSSSSMSSSSTVSSMSSAVGSSGASSTPLVRKSSLPSSQPKNINRNNTNRGPTNTDIANTNTGTGSGDVVRKQSVNASKPMLVPGRRSSLLQTGQMPTPVNTSSSSGSTLSPGVGRNNSYTPKSPTLSGSSSPTLSPQIHAQSSLSLSPTLSPSSPGSFSFGNGVPPSPSLSPTLSPTLANKPAISRRTSSLPTERPRQIQRLPSSENGSTLSSLSSVSGLPRPLQISSMSSLSSSPPSPSTVAPSGPKHLAPYPYSRSVSDEQINFSSYQNQQQQYTRHGASSASAPTSPSHPPLPPISSSYSGVSVSAASPSGSLTKPLPSYTLNKASKSSPNLVDGGSVSNYYGEPALPLGLDLQYQQQFQQQFFQKSPPSSPSTATGQGEQHKSSSGSGFNKLLSRTSSRRGAGNTTPESYSGQSGATSIGAAMTISSPLSLISSVDQESFHHQHHQYQYQSQPTHKAQDSMNSSPRSYGHGYSQSVGHTFNSGHGSPSSTGASASASGSGGGNRWSSMKTMLGLRVGQTKG
ncbi:hypothetical protein CPC16_001508 [Podila verticillata]|nr:hypothetical protein CPC16_001508 [Podila verticillata]